MDREAWRVTVHEIAKSQTRMSDYNISFFHLHRPTQVAAGKEGHSVY